MPASFIFVYGTLQRHERNHHYLNSSTFIGEALLSDYALYNLPQGYHGILPYQGYQVRGEVYEVDETTLGNLDLLEGEGSLYKRASLQVALSDHKMIHAFTYVYLRPVHDSWRNTQLVAHWRGNRM